jgi:hypothetical protein
MREFVTRAVKQLAEQTVMQYRLAFEAKPRNAKSLGGDPALIAHYFVQGLLPHLQKNCIIITAGQPFDTLGQANQHALAEEQRNTSTHSKGKTLTTGTDAVFQGAAKKQKTYHSANHYGGRSG